MAKGVTLSQGRAALLVFIGGASYGANATCYKLSYEAGFSWAQMVAAQVWFACALFALATIIGILRGGSWVRLGRTSTCKLLGLGLLTSVTSVCYCYAMSVLPVPLALTLLFQFTWIGTVVQVIMTRRAPSVPQVLAAAVVMVGTVFASGLYASELGSFEPLGLVSGLAAAVSCALFVTFSGKVQVPCPEQQRGLVVCSGAFVASLFICPDFLTSGALVEGIAPMGFVAGFTGFLLPVMLFGMGMPHLPAGLGTVLPAAELPAGLFIAMLVLGTPIELLQWLGVALIMGGVVLAQLKLPRRKAQR
ncbi:MAG: DMT family transporter [Coriobacteriia bacterium]|nr:DMT family transporter [Coriobacteriia bacterium]